MYSKKFTQVGISPVWISVMDSTPLGQRRFSGDLVIEVTNIPDDVTVSAVAEVLGTMVFVCVHQEIRILRWDQCKRGAILRRGEC